MTTDADGPRTTSPPAAAAVRTTWLEPGQTLKAGDSVRSADGECALRRKEDGSLVPYKGRAALRSSLTAGSPRTGG